MRTRRRNALFRFEKMKQMKSEKVDFRNQLKETNIDKFALKEEVRFLADFAAIIQFHKYRSTKRSPNGRRRRPSEGRTATTYARYLSQAYLCSSAFSLMHQVASARFSHISSPQQRPHRQCYASAMRVAHANESVCDVQLGCTHLYSLLRLPRSRYRCTFRHHNSTGASEKKRMMKMYKVSIFIPSRMLHHHRCTY